MAKLTDAASDHRSVASRIPADILDRLTPEECRHRAAHVYALEKRSPATGEAGQLLRAHATRLLSALPIHESLAEQKRLHGLAVNLPAGIDSPRHEMSAAAAKIRSENMYPPGFEAACEKRALGRSVDYPEADIDAILGYLPLSKTPKPQAKPAKPGNITQQDITKAAQAATKGLSDRLSAVQAQLSQWKMTVASDYLAAGQKIPSSLGITLDQHPDAERWNALAKEAEDFRDRASRIGEADLAEVFKAKAQDLDLQAKRLKAAAERSFS